MAKKNVVESAKAGNFHSSPGSSPLTISDIPQPLSGVKGFKHIAPDDEILQDGHHKEILSDADAPQAALASADLALETSEPPMMLAMAEGAAAGGVAGGEVAAGAGGIGGLGMLLIGGGVVGGGVAVHSYTKNSHDDPPVYIQPASKPATVNVVVEKTGAFIDANANGILDGEEACHAANFDTGGNADLTRHDVLIHFNDAPDTVLNLTGFGSDDLIELDVTGFAGGALADHSYGFFQQGFTLNAVSVAAEGSSTWRAGFSNFTINRNSGQFPEFWAGGKAAELTLGNWSSKTTTTTGPTSAPVKNVHTHTNQLLASNLHLADPANQIHLVNFVEPVTNKVSVVVEHSGFAYIDTDGDGFLDASENFSSNIADFGSGGNADLTANEVTIHFNGIPTDGSGGHAPLNLANFDFNDKVEIDIAQFQQNVFVTAAGFGMFADLEQLGPDLLGSYMNNLTAWDRHFGLSLSGSATWTGNFGNGVFKGPVVNPAGFAGPSGHLPTAQMRFNTAITGFSGLDSGTGNASSISMKGWVIGGGSGASGGVFPLGLAHVGTKMRLAIDGTLATNSSAVYGHQFAIGVNMEAANHGQISMVDAALVYGVDANGAWLDSNENGLRDGGNEIAIGSGGTIDASQQTVVFHVYDAPDTPIDVTGFGLDDRILIDSGALANQHTARGDVKFLQAGALGGWFANNSGSGGVKTAESTFRAGYLGFTGTNGYYGVTLEQHATQKVILYSNINGTGSSYGSHQLFDLHSATAEMVVAPGVLGHVVDFVKYPELNVIVNGSGAFIDANFNGMIDLDESCSPVIFSGGGSTDLTTHAVTIHFDGVPGSALDLSGFNADDRIELDAQGLASNYWNPMLTGNGGSPYNPSAFSAVNLHTQHGSSLSIAPRTSLGIMNDGPINGWLAQFSPTAKATTTSSGWMYNPGAHVNGGNLAAFYCHTTSSGPQLAHTHNGSLAYNLHSGLDLAHQISFVNFVEPVHVVVESWGAYIDDNGDGVYNDSCCLASFSGGGNADLSTHAVIIHFNDVPPGSLDLTGFSSNDRIELDVTGFLNNVWNPAASSRGATSSFNFNNFNEASKVNIASGPTLKFVSRSSGNTLLSTPSVNGWLAQFAPTTLATTSFSAGYIYNPGWYIENGSLKEFFGHSYYSTPSAINRLDTVTLAHNLGSSVDFASQVSLVNFNLHVVVDSNGAFMDTNSDGVHQAGETAVASFSGGGNADLSFNHVTVHYNELPATPINLSGFGEDDRIEIDLNGMNYQQMNTPRNNQTAIGHTHGVSNSGNTGAYLPSSPRFAVYTSGNSLKYGRLSNHLTTTGSTTLWGTTSLGSPTPIGMSPLFTSVSNFVTHSGGGVLATNLSGAYIPPSQIIIKVDFLASVE